MIVNEPFTGLMQYSSKTLRPLKSIVALNREEFVKQKTYSEQLKVGVVNFKDLGVILKNDEVFQFGENVKKFKVCDCYILGLLEKSFVVINHLTNKITEFNFGENMAGKDF